MCRRSGTRARQGGRQRSNGGIGFTCVTSLFRLEQGIWKLVHRHADPITSPRPAASVIGG
jgi:hypothetical protein